MPVVQHLEDAAAVAGSLWDGFLAPNVRRVISAGLSHGDRGGRVLATFLAGTHDVGKVSTSFAGQLRGRPEFNHVLAGMAKEGLSVGSPDGWAGHGSIGQVALEDWLSRRGWRSLQARKLGVVVGGHHGIPPTASQLAEVSERPWLMGEGPWEHVRNEILDEFAERCGFDDLPTNFALSSQAQVLLTAVVVLADWLASDDLRFPHVLAEQDMEQRVAAANIHGDLLKQWIPDPPEPEDLFRERFPLIGRPHAMQDAVVGIASAQEGPALMIIEAQMGQGKTEAGLAAAEILAAKCGMSGVYVGLPTMATSDAMFGRVLPWASTVTEGQGVSVSLVHGKASLNDDFSALVSSGFVDPAGVYDEEGPEAGDIAASTWLSGRRKSILASMVVGTIDQSLIAALKAKHVALRHLALASKVVVVDEVHAADVYMSRYLDRALEWLGSYGVPVILLSATLPPQRRGELLDAYATGLGLESRSTSATDCDELDQDSYPRISVQSTGSRQSHAPGADSGNRVISVEIADSDPSAILNRIAEALAEGACVGIIVNTVTRAQTLFEGALNRFPSTNVRLVHSRFVADQRFRIEAQIREELGPDARRGSGRPDGLLVIGTQVLEQSLDIDFDLLVTDLAPIDLVLQRAGRLHRHERGTAQAQRPESVRRPTLVVAGIPDFGAEPLVDGGGKAIYGEAALLRSAAVLRDHFEGRPITVPSDIPRLVRRGYADAVDVPSAWGKRWSVAEGAAAIARIERTANADAFKLQAPSRRSIAGFVEAGTSEEDERGVAQVRDGEDSFEVIVMQRVAGEISVIPGGELGGMALPRVDLEVPSNALARKLLRYSVSLPSAMCKGQVGDYTIRDLEELAGEFTAWQRSPWLKGELILILDENLSAEINGFHLRYDASFGLRYEKLSKDQRGGR